MAKGSFLGCVFVVIVLVLLPLHSGSPLMSSADLRSDSDLVCDGLWHRFRSLCWTPVPPSVTLYDASQADRYCNDRGARVLSVARHHFCVQGAERLSDYSDPYNQFEPLSSAKHKRIMGNNGY